MYLATAAGQYAKHAQTGHSREVLHVPRHERRIVEEGGRRNERVHRGHGLSDSGWWPPDSRAYAGANLSSGYTTRTPESS